MIILERILPDKAVIYEQGAEKDIPLGCLGQAAEGDVLILKNGVYVKDAEATEKRRKEILALQNSLWA
ncbi:MAG: DUF3006 domain-containing protein [Ruminococcus sp.]|nr:DUF3006 domain-containing protein [Ruminococcus sp.]